MMRYRKTLQTMILLGGAGFVLALIPPCAALDKLEGHGRVEMSKGHPEKGHIELYEWDVWLTPDGEGENRVRRTGAPPGEGVRHDGYYSFYPLAGRYSLYLNQPEWWVRPKVVPNIEVKDGKPLVVHAIPPVDYSMGFGNNMGVWEGKGDPWDWATTWHQTFVALGTGITKVQFKLAGTNTDRIRVSVHEDSGDPNPENWPQVGPERVIPKVGTMGDNWTGWLSGEVPTRPGKTYAVRLHDAGGNADFGPFVHRDALGGGYEKGTAYGDGEARPHDLYMIVSADNDGSLIAYAKRAASKPDGLAGWAVQWGQTWKAVGKSLAGMDLFAASGSSRHSAIIHAEVTVHRGGPGGEQIGPTKRVNTAWWGPGVGIFGVSYSPGEVPLTPGGTYYIQVTTVDPKGPGVEDIGFNPVAFQLPDDAYPSGMAYKDGKRQPDVDLEMTIVEWTSSPALPKPQPASVPPGLSKNLLENGDMENGQPGNEGDPVPEGWTRWKRRPTAWWYDTDFGRNGTLGSRVIGGSINGTKIQGGIVQRVDGLSPVEKYRLSGWVRTSHVTSNRHAAFLGYDTTGQTEDPFAPSVQWIPTGNLSNVFRRVVSEPIRPSKDSVSVWTRGENEDTGEVFTVDFDDLVLEQL
jgi:hypothetical protein